MTIPSVIQGLVETEDGKVFELETPKGSAWLESIGSFRFEPSDDSKPYTVRKESGYWYGCRKIAGKVRKKYIGKSLEVTVAKLEEIAEALEIPPAPRANKVAQEVAQEVAQDRLTALELQVDNLQKAVEALQEALLGKLESGDSSELPKVDNGVAERLQSELGNLKAENEKLRADYAALLGSSTAVTKKLREEVQELRSQLEAKKISWDKLWEELGDSEATCAKLRSELADLKQKSATASKKISELEGENSEQFAELKKQDAEIEELKSELARRSEGKSEKSAAASQDLPDAVNLSGKAGELLSFFKTLLPKNIKLPSSTISKIEKILEE